MKTINSRKFMDDKGNVFVHRVKMDDYGLKINHIDCPVAWLFENPIKNVDYIDGGGKTEHLLIINGKRMEHIKRK